MLIETRHRTGHFKYCWICFLSGAELRLLRMTSTMSFAVARYPDSKNGALTS